MAPEGLSFGVGSAAGWGLTWASILLGLAAALASTLSALIERSGPIRLRHWAEESEGIVRSLYEHPVRFEGYRLLLSLLAKLFPVALFWSLVPAFLISPLAGRPAWAAFEAGALVFVLLGATEILNRILVSWDPEAALTRLTGVYRLLLIVLAPLVALSVFLFPSRLAQRRAFEEEGDDVSDDEIEAFIDVGTREGILDPGEDDLLRGIVDFGDTAVRSVMTPRIDVQGASVDATLSEIADRFVESGHSRLPVYEGSIDHVVGIVHIRDLLRAMRAGASEAARDIAKPAFFVPETKPLGQLLRELQARFLQVAVVVDEYGGTAGVVTVEDLIEEIVGEIADEHEAAYPENQLLPDGAWLLAGSTDVESLETLFGIELADDHHETVGGMVFGLLGDVPSVGDTVESRGLRYTVEEAEERRVARVRVEAVPPQPPSAESGGEGAP